MFKSYAISLFLSLGGPMQFRITRGCEVMDANLLLFKTVIAGDSWGLIAVPVHSSVTKPG